MVRHRRLPLWHRRRMRPALTAQPAGLPEALEPTRQRTHAVGSPRFWIAPTTRSLSQLGPFRGRSAHQDIVGLLEPGVSLETP